MTEEEVNSLLATPNKLVVRPFAWSVEVSGHVPRTHVFESGVQVGKEVLEGVIVRARYRDAKIIDKGSAPLTIPESFSCAIFVGNDRVAAIDTNPRQRHSNLRAGEGREFYGQTIAAWTHRHVWTGAYGYVEPVEPPLLDAVKLIVAFAVESNLIFQGTIEHPLKGETGRLI